MTTTAPMPAPTPIPVQLSEPEFEAFILPHLSMPKRGPKCKLGYYRVFNLILRVLSVAERLTQERYNVTSSTQTTQASCYPKRARRCAMDSIQLWARDGEAVRQAMELG